MVEELLFKYDALQTEEIQILVAATAMGCTIEDKLFPHNTSFHPRTRNRRQVKVGHVVTVKRSRELRAPRWMIITQE